MKIYIPSKNRSDTIRSHLVFDGLDYTVVVHNEQQATAYADNSTVPVDRIVVSGTEPDYSGLIRQRQWIVDNLVELGEWFIFADDNIWRVEAFPPPYYYEEELEFPVKGSPIWRKRFKTPCQPDDIMDIAYEMVEKAVEVGVRLCGFATNDNYYFNRKKWSYVKYVSGKMMVLQNCGIPYDPSIPLREDIKYTAEHLLRYGIVLVNNFARPHAKHFQRGGLGTYSERVEHMQYSAHRLMDMFPGLLRWRHPKTPKDALPDADVALRIHTLEQVERWRESMRDALVYVDKTPVLEER